MLRVAIAQIDPIVGAFESNIKKIKEAYERACSQQARLLLTPELSVCGYPPLDLIDRPEMIERCQRAVDELARLTQGQSCALAVGHVAASLGSEGRGAQNVVTVLEGGKAVFRQAKMLLPTYDVFDECRYFKPADEVQLWSCDGWKVAFAICEDLWGEYSISGRKLYPQKNHPVDRYEALKPDLLLSLSSSPYEWKKKDLREALHREIAKRLKAPLVYVNQVGTTDEIGFDGGSFAIDATGTLQGRLPFFEKAFGVGEVLKGKSDGSVALRILEGTPDPNDISEMEILSRALVTGIREYFQRTGFKKAVMGLSGGIDSAVVAALAVRALGAENVRGVAMPSQYSSSHSLEDAEQLAQNLKMPFEVKPIKFLYSTCSRELSERRGQLAPIALENLQARLRGVVLMTFSNHDSALVLTTGNKSEIATGYCTLYGDMVGALAPIGDLFKTRVYELARYLNQAWGNVIPERSITKAPSAELRPNQTDQDSLPPYELLDEFLEEYLENGVAVAEIEAKMEVKMRAAGGSDLKWIPEILRKIEINEYKRRQAAPILKVSKKAFGLGRRIPLAKRWELKG